MTADDSPAKKTPASYTLQHASSSSSKNTATQNQNHKNKSSAAPKVAKTEHASAPPRQRQTRQPRLRQQPLNQHQPLLLLPRLPRQSLHHLHLHHNQPLQLNQQHLLLRKLLRLHHKQLFLLVSIQTEATSLLLQALPQDQHLKSLQKSASKKTSA